MALFDEWDSFYLIVGGAAGALIGLQFVVMTLIAERRRMTSAAGGSAFATPTIVHFSTVLLIAAIVRAPWHEIAAPSTLWGLIGLGGVVYGGVVIRRVRTQHDYRPDLDDWCFYVLLPLAAHLALGVSALLARAHARESLFIVGGSTLVLVACGIHNSWDAIAYHVFTKRELPEARSQRPAEQS